MPISEEQANKIEGKIDKLTDAVNRLAIIDERQIEAGRRVGNLEDRLAKAEVYIANTDKKVDTWINRGLGAWGLVGFLFALYQTFAPLWK